MRLKCNRDFFASFTQPRSLVGAAGNEVEFHCGFATLELLSASLGAGSGNSRGCHPYPCHIHCGGMGGGGGGEGAAVIPDLRSQRWARVTRALGSN